MKTLLKLALTLMVLLAAVLPLSAGTPAAPKPNATAMTAGKARYYYVYYRYSAHHPWILYGYYRSLPTAQYVAYLLHYYYGVETFIR